MEALIYQVLCGICAVILILFVLTCTLDVWFGWRSVRCNCPSPSCPVHRDKRRGRP